MDTNSTNSFLRFVLGFFAFLAIFFGITIAVNHLSDLQAPAEQAATAVVALLHK